jgi:phage-related protein
VNGDDKPLVWLAGEIKTPPFTAAGRIEAGTFLRRLQRGEELGMPHSRAMPAVGRRCHELRVRDGAHNWRILYRTDPDAIVILEIFAKKTGKTPANVIETCKARLKAYDALQ